MTSSFCVFGRLAGRSIVHDEIRRSPRLSGPMPPGAMRTRRPHSALPSCAAPAGPNTTYPMTPSPEMTTTPLSPAGTDGHDQRARGHQHTLVSSVVGGRSCREPQDPARRFGRAHACGNIPGDADRLRHRDLDQEANAGNHRSAPRSEPRTRSNASNSNAERSTPAAIDFDILTSSATRPRVRNTHRSHTSARS